MKIYLNNGGLSIVNEKESKAVFLDGEGPCIYAEDITQLVPEDAEFLFEVENDLFKEAIKCLQKDTIELIPKIS